ncbi:MAG: transcription elongation factor Spt5 [Candidatus Woesearchaeota archaeon]|jgi:transcriptional antiterminator NusG
MADTQEQTSNQEPKLFAIRTTANREDQVIDFVYSNAEKKGLNVFSLVHPHGMRGYLFIEAESKYVAEQAVYGVPYVRGLLEDEMSFSEITHLLETTKIKANIEKNDIVEIITSPFKGEKAKIARVDLTKDEVVVELLQAAVPIPITLSVDSVKVIRRENE